jgi:hypothetical protein
MPPSEAPFKTPAGREQPLLYLDFDGVLMHERVLHDDQRGPFLDAPERYLLFQHAWLLAQLLEPHPTVQLVLSTAWAQKYGLQKAVGHLPESLQSRVVGATYELAEPGDFFAHLSKGEQVALDVERRRPSDWLALDDDMVGWPKWAETRVVFTDPYEGISAPGVLKTLRKALEQLSHGPLTA